jgi:hypothetical protein
MRKTDKQAADKFKRILSSTSESDFDGHTEFGTLSAEDKLLWLSQSAQFIARARNCINPDETLKKK